MLSPVGLMKTTDAAEVINGAHDRMKPQNASQRKGSAGRRSAPVRIPQIPMEWMDPMSWRLPSGKALSEFALQAGFLAPLMIGTPRLKKKKIAGGPADPAALAKRVKEAPAEPSMKPASVTRSWTATASRRSSISRPAASSRSSFASVGGRRSVCSVHRAAN